MRSRFLILASFSALVPLLFQNSRADWVALTGAAAIALLAAFALPVDAYLALAAMALLAVIAVLATAVQLDHAVAGFALLVTSGVAFPVEFSGVKGVMMSSSLPLAGFLCAAWLVRTVSAGSLAVLDRSRVVWAVVTFMAVMLVAFGAGQFPWFPSGGAPVPAQLVELGIMLISACLFLAVGHQVTSVRQLKVLTWLFVAAGVFACLVQMVPSLIMTVGPMTSRPSSIGSLFWTWLGAITFAQAIFNRRLAPAVRVFLLLVTAAVFYHGFFSARAWASGWVPLLAALAAILLVKLPRLSISAAVLAMPVFILLSSHVSSVWLAEEEYSLATRQEALRVLWTIIERSPVIGTGPANYYYYTENFPILGYYVRFFSHNNYEDLLIQAGVIGLLAFCWLAFEMLRMVARAYGRAPVGFPRAYVVGVFGGLTGSLVAGMLGDWIIPFYYNAGILGFRSSLLLWVFVGGVLALNRMQFNAPDVQAAAADQDFLAFESHPRAFR